MRLKRISPRAAGAVLLGIAMGALVVGFALFLLPANEAVAAPSTWAFAIITAVAVALLTAQPFNRQPAKSPRP